MSKKRVDRARLIRPLAIAGTLVALVAVIWLDVRTSIWQDVVILSGIAAGLVTFLLTALFLDQALARAEHSRWVPVTRLALTDLLHTLSHDDSRLHRGEFLPRGLTVPELSDGSDAARSDDAKIDELLQQVLTEREELTETLSRWSAFLAASADVHALLDHLAALAVHLDDVRDAALELESRVDRSDSSALDLAVRGYNTRVEHSIAELHHLLASLEDELEDRDDELPPS